MPSNPLGSSNELGRWKYVYIFIVSNLLSASFYPCGATCVYTYHLTDVACQTPSQQLIILLFNQIFSPSLAHFMP